LVPGFEVRVESAVNNVARLIVSGEVDPRTSEMLFEELIFVLSAEGIRHVEVDLAGVTLLDASGIGVLLAAQNRADAADKVFSICRVSGLPLQVLEITGVLGRLHGKSAGLGRGWQSERNQRWSPYEP
jgi:anti-anti-sigma factor